MIDFSMPAELAAERDRVRQFVIDKTNALFMPVKPRPGVTVVEAENAVTIALRESRR